MKPLLSLLLLCFSFCTFAQFPETKEGPGFDSVFQNLKEGTFSGNASGELRIVNLSGDTVKISFDTEYALLQIIPDPDEVYDVSRKVYSSDNEEGKATFRYSTYAHANAIFLRIDGQDFGMNLIDGDCYSVFKNLDYNYSQKEKQEELDLHFTGNVGLSCPPSHIGPQLILLAGSRLVFRIDRPILQK